MEMAIAASAGYLLGSLPFGFLIVRGRGIDLRRAGSGNVGATNVHRTAGPRLGLTVLVIDILKGAAAVVAVGWIVPAEQAVAVAGVAAVVGHAYPIWLRFAGGKGVAVAAGVFAMLAPEAAAAAAVVFVLVVWATRFVSLGSVLATMTLLAVEWLGPESRAVSLAATGAAALILFRHRGNVARLLTGREPRLGDRVADRSSW
jgi:glycerol-3-phosphate acyltransferase PlsY